MKAKLFACLALAMMAGCTSVPPTNVHQPMSMRPLPRPEMQGGNGAIFQAAVVRPLFEDRRARHLGDTLTIRITENTAASAKANNKLDRSQSNNTSISAMARLPGQSLLGTNLQTSSSSAFEGKGEAANNNVFNGTLTVTVIDVYPNGNLLVSGEKQLAIGNEQEFIRVSGVINPSFVDFSNTIDSSKVADARIEYKKSGQIGEGLAMGWLARFFLNVLPF
jgi:flagellar L-ring protein precursor FlgH